MRALSSLAKFRTNEILVKSSAEFTTTTSFQAIKKLLDIGGRKTNNGIYTVRIARNESIVIRESKHQANTTVLIPVRNFKTKPIFP